MYYNRITGKLVLDSFDLWLISFFITSQIVSHFKESLSEKAKMKRLKDDIIKKSRVIDTSSFRNYSNYTDKRIKKIYNFALKPRGGQIEDIKLAQQFAQESKLAQQIKKMIHRTVIFLMTKENNARVFKRLFTVARLALQFVLIRCNIQIQYLVIDGITQQVAIISMCSGGTLGFIYGWFAAGTFLIVTPAVLSAFVLRSLFQQYMNFKQYQEILKFSVRLAKDKEFRESIINMIHGINNQIEENMNLINLKNLNWNKNPEIKQAAERLGIFQNPPKIDGPLHLDTLDFDLELEEMLENLGLLQKPKAPSIEELNEFLKSNPTTIKTLKDITTDTLISENELEIS